MTAKRPATRRAANTARAKTTLKTTAKSETKTKTKTTVKAKAAAKSRTVAKARNVPATRAAGVAARAKTPAATRRHAAPKGRPVLRDIVLGALAELKAVDVRALDVRGITDITDIMVVASGTSDRHVKSIADRVVQRCKEAGYRPYGLEGERDGEWVLLDLQDVVLHVMLPRVREFYALEKLWESGAAA
jgi:ribosome silencing factor RsfS/YbeB/iojap